jgi:hypothetical protein
VVEDAEVFGAEAEESGSVDFGLAADEVGLLGVEGLVVLVEPDVFGVVAVVEEDGRGVPVEFLLWEKGAPLEDENALPCLCQVEGEGSTAGSSSDDYRVIWLGMVDVPRDGGGRPLYSSVIESAMTGEMLITAVRLRLLREREGRGKRQNHGGWGAGCSGR